MRVFYLLALCAALGSMVLLDRRFALVFWRDARRAAAVLVTGVLFFLLWDVFGIGLGIFSRGEGRYLTGNLLLPDLPLEEVFFLTFLCYLTLVLLTGSVRMLATLGERRNGS
ncbi:MAG: lycopene cyclase domain-containing protein [Leifsonia sp.]